MTVLDSAPVVEADELVKRFDGGRPAAVDGVSLRIGRGEVYGLLGPNGSGKSTLVAMLATLTLPTSGRARVVGHDVVDAPAAARRHLGVALQDASVDPDATGRELLVLHARLFGASRRDATARAQELLAEVELVDAADRRIRTYSGGMRRRLDLAAAVVGRPAVLMLDEPTTGLDPASREALWARVLALRDAGAAVLLTTQYLEEADRLADRVGILAEGRLLVEGAPAELKDRHDAASLDDVFFEVTGLPRAPRGRPEVTVVAS